MKVYIVECGEYSGRYVSAVFDNEDAAYAYALENHGSLSDCEVESGPITYSKRVIRPGERVYWVKMGQDGQNATTMVVETEADEPSAQKDDYFGCSVWADSPEHAIKQVNEMRTGWLIGGKRTKPSNNPYWQTAIL